MITHQQRSLQNPGKSCSIQVIYKEQNSLHVTALQLHPGILFLGVFRSGAVSYTTKGWIDKNNDSLPGKKDERLQLFNFMVGKTQNRPQFI